MRVYLFAFALLCEIGEKSECALGSALFKLNPVSLPFHNHP